jgi:lipid II:glycine glycyltransferase (peptidoglycan interpeptide bridge formation enzyme)
MDVYQQSWNEWSKGHKDKATLENKFKLKFYDVYAHKPGLYMFIVTNQQLRAFETDIDTVGMRKWLYKRIDPAVNSNYIDEGPKLHMFIFNITKDDHV